VDDVDKSRLIVQVYNFFLLYVLVLSR